MRSVRSALQIALLAAVTASPAFAQETEAPAPSRSTESYESWTLECTSVSVAPPAAADAKPADTKKDEEQPAVAGEVKRVCEAAQVFTNRKTGNEIARMVFALDPKGTGGLVAGMRTLVDVSFEKKPALVDGETELASGSITRCNNGFCYVLFSIDDKKVEQFAQTKAPAVQFPIASGQMLRMNMSTAGLNNALTALKAKK